MLETEVLLKNNNIIGALDNLKLELSSRPDNVDLRIFLFQLLSVVGDYDKALTQINILLEIDSKTIPLSNTYQPILLGEKYRTEVFERKVELTLFDVIESDTPLENHNASSLVEDRFSIVRKPYDINISRPRDEDDLHLKLTSDISGMINDIPFSAITDGDSRIGPSLELIIDGQYGWVSFNSIRRMVFEAPCDLRDLVWFPVEITWESGCQTMAFVPTRYVDTTEQKNMNLWMSRSTSWHSIEDSENSFFGFGQRTLLTNNDEFPLLDIREIVINDVN